MGGVLASIAAVVLMLCLPAAAAQTPPSEGEVIACGAAVGRPSCPMTADSVGRTAQRICGGTPIDEALLAVRLRPGAAAGEAARLLTGLGFAAAVDLQLLSGGPEVSELMSELKVAGMSVGDRSKVRLLVGDTAHLERLVGSDVQAGGHVAHYNTTSRTIGGLARRLQADPTEKDKTKDTGGLSTDTIAFVLTVLVGAAGFALQARMPASSLVEVLSVELLQVA